MKKFCILLAIVLLFSIAFQGCKKTDNNLEDSVQASNSSSQIECSGFDSARKAFEAYLDSYKSGDVAKSISCFSVETFTANCDLNKNIERYSYYDISMPKILPDDNNSFANGIDNYSRISNINRQLYNGYRYLVGYPMEVSNETFTNDKSKIDDFIDDLTDYDFVEKLNKMEIVSVYSIEDFDESLQKAYSDVLNNGAYSKQSDALGYDEMKSFAANVIFDDKDYYFFMDVAKYGNKWYCLTPVSVLGMLCGTSANDGGMKLKSEVDKYIEDMN